MKLLLLLLTLFIAAVYGMSIIQYWTDTQFMAKAERTEGRIDNIAEVITDQKNQRKEWQVTYSYIDGTSAFRSNTQAVPYLDILSQMAVGQNVGVYYRRDDSTQSHLEPVIQRRMDWNSILNPKQ
jgi:hypothetical protein